MQENYSAYERFLGFERLKTTRDLMRARSVYIIGWAFIFTQFINIFLMTMSFGEWTGNHWIALGGICSIVVVVHALRFTHNFTLFALAYSTFLFGGVCAAAIYMDLGINSATLPLLVAGCLLNGFVGGPRLVWIYAVASIMLVWWMYSFSVFNPPENYIANSTYRVRIFQRATQETTALILTSVFSGYLSGAMNRMFMKLENRIDDLALRVDSKSRFLEVLTQEIEKPVGGVAVAGKQLSQTQLNADQIKLIGLIQKCAQRLVRLTRDAGELSRLDRGGLELNESAFNLRDMIKVLVTGFNPRAVRKNIHIGTTYGAQLPEIYIGDEKRIKTVLRNIISNALKFTDAGSVHVYVDGRLKGADEVELRMTIKDTGTGMSRDVMTRVFNRFEQANGMTYQQSAGRGNGLAIAREYINFMGGDIRVESQVGEGSKFEISLTLHAAEGLKVSPPPDPHSAPVLSANQAA